MSSDPKLHRGLHLRLVTLLFPPLGLLLLWRSSVKVWRKILGTFGILLYLLLYAGVVIWLLVRFTGLEVEWRGGYVPRLTYYKTRPDYDALERHRAKYKSGTNGLLSPPISSNPDRIGTGIGAGEANNRPASAHTADWPAFRGPRGDGVYDAKPILTNWPVAGIS